ncbi:hypothetical protein LEP1GSC041_1505 [Leptospira noguchii str. 2006001870]|nr:hypothetical protein LEP1GSC041_1505 [Leptospira noguchii str. 2006001870]
MQLINQSGEPGPAPVASRIRPFFLHRTQQLLFFLKLIRQTIL